MLIGLLVVAVPLAAVEINKSQHDNREYKYLILDNGLRVILVSDPDTELAAAALDVDVGSLHNDPAREGMAHFLEHMLFLGTQKYPRPDEYREYIERHGGTNGAFTALMDTRYYFNVLPEYLPGALDRFAQFFIAPNFNADLVERERNAVHAEYTLKYQNDMLRAYRVDGITANPQHSYGLFSCGNNDTLGDAPGRPAVRDQLIEFYQQHYTAQRMILAVVGPQTLAELETMVRKEFSAISNREVANNVIEELAFTSKETGVQILVKPIAETSRLLLNFPIPQQFQNYDNQSVEYINYMLSQSAAGGLEHTLRDEQWIVGMYVGNENISHKQDLLHVSFELTDSGVDHINEIVEYFYAYVNFLREQGPQQRLFADLKSAGEREFNYKDKLTAVQLATDLPYAVKHYPVEDILYADTFAQSTKFDATKIAELLEMLTPANMRMFVIDKSVNTNKSEKYYQVEYSIDKFTSQQLHSWNAKNETIKFKLPQKNPYLPNDFRLYNASTKASAKQTAPEQIISDLAVKLWYMPDQRFKLPKEDIKIQFAMHGAQSSPRRALLQKFLVLALDDRLQEQQQLFELAGIDVNIVANQEGLLISINMFSDQEEVLLHELMKSISQIKLSPQRFTVYKDFIARDLESFKYDLPAMQAYEVVQSLILSPKWVPTQMTSELASITLADLEQYTQEFLAQMQVEGFIHGNLSKAKALTIFNTSLKRLELNANRTPTPFLPTLVQLTDKSNYTYEFAPDHNDAALVSYAQSAQIGDKAIATNALLTRIMQGSLFDQLRTQEQLAYFVDLMIFRVLEQPGMIFIIQSSDKTPQYLHDRFVSFMQDFDRILPQMSTDDFNQYRISLQRILTKQPDKLSTQTAIYWEQIRNHSYRFSFNQDIAKQLDLVTLEDVSVLLKKLWLDNSTQRKVTVISASDQPYTDGLKIDSIASFKSKES